MSAPRWLSEPEMQTWLNYLEASHLLERRIEQQLQEDAGLSHAQYDILTKLSKAPDKRMRMTELARGVVVSKSGLTYQVGRLEDSGFVQRVADPADERGVWAVLTAKGQRLLRRTAPGHLEMVRNYLIDLLTQDQLTALAEIMGAVRGKIRAEE